MPPPRRNLPCKCLTGKGVFALILDFPDGLKSVARTHAARNKKAPHLAAHSNSKLHNSSPFSLVEARPHSTLAHDDSHSDETHLPALQGSPRPHARIPRSHEDSRRPSCHQCQARQGSQAVVFGLSRSVVDTLMLGRLLRSADFESVLATPIKARSAHFAAHHLPSRPSAPKRRRASDQSAELSTADQDGCPQVVEDHAEPAPSDWWLGVVVPKRHAARAATRNLLRRQIRGAMARRHAELSRGIWLVRLRAPFEPRIFKSAASGALRDVVHAELERLLSRAAA